MTESEHGSSKQQTGPADLAQPPHSPALHVPRTRLDSQLDAAAKHRVCLIVAGAGWGKTTALADWADPTRTAWLTLRARDTRLDRLFGRLVTALRPYLSEVSPAAANPDPDSDEHACASMLARACEGLQRQPGDELVLALDDLQELPVHCAAARFVADLCRHPPDALHLVLCSRVEPPFPVERLRGQGHLTEIDATHLGFDVDDVAALLRMALGDEATDLATPVWKMTGGWPTVVCFAADAMRGIDPERRLDAMAQLSRSGGRLSNYLIEEVVDREPERVRDFLHRLAVLGKIDLPVAHALGVENPARLLTDLTRRGLVHRTAGSKANWSVLRPLRDCLDESVITESDRAALHSTAAKELASRGAYAEALRHLVSGSDPGAVASLLIEHGTTLVGTGEIDAVLAAAELPAGWLDDPRVQRVIGHAQQVGGQWASALEYFQRTTREQDELQPGLAWRMGLGLYARGEFDKALEMYRRARLDRENTADEAHLLAWSASASRMVGDYDHCRRLAHRAVTAADRCHDQSARAAGYSALTLLAAAQGDPLRTDEYGAVALNAAESAGDLLETVRIKAFQAMHLLARGQPADGLREAESALELSERCGHRLVVALALTHRGTARARLGQLDEALDDFLRAREVFRDMGSRLIAWPLNGIGSVYRIRGQLAQARAAYEEGLAIALTGHEVLGLAGALSGLARTRAADDLAAARALAEEAVAVGEGLWSVQALLSRGWIALLGGDREAASADAASAAGRARARRDNPGLAEALELTVLASVTPAESTALLDEAVEMWRDAGYPVEEAEARLVTALVVKGGPAGATAAAEQTLRDQGVRRAAGLAAGPLAAAQAQSAPTVSIRALGTFAVLLDGVPVSTAQWQSRRARDLLKILVSRRRPVPREQLTELLWPDERPAKLGNRLSVLLSTVRGVLEPGRERQAEGCLCTDGNSVWLDSVDVDVEQFLTTATAALDAHARGQPDTLDRLLAAESSYTGAFLEDDPYQDWASAMAEEVRATYLAVLRALSGQLRRDGGSGAADRAVRYTLRLLSEDPYDEAAHLELVAILLEAGRLGEARRRYELYAQQISELEVTPQPFPGL